MAYHAGVLRALEEVGGFAPDDADVVVGTSAGSMVGAALRSGLTTEDMWLASLGQHPDLELEHPEGNPWARTWQSPFDVFRRLLGSAYVLQRSMMRFPLPALPRELQRLFPGGFYTIADADDLLSRFMPKEWPDKLLWLVTVDVRSGRRVVLGRRRPARTDLHTAVKASCAIPGFFQPQRVGRRTLVDGGVHSTTNLDLTTKIEPDAIVAVVPMGFDPAHPPSGIDVVVRRFAQRALEREVAQAERKGAKVLVLRPTGDDLRAMGRNMMRPEGNEVVTKVAYDSAARQLATPEADEVLSRLRATVGA